jgi:hypothetical protein
MTLRDYNINLVGDSLLASEHPVLTLGLLCLGFFDGREESDSSSSSRSIIKGGGCERFKNQAVRKSACKRSPMN